MKNLKNFVDFYQETSKLSGACKALYEAAYSEKVVERRVCLKILLKNMLKQLITDLHILAGDRNSKISLTKLVKEFERTYGGKAKVLGEMKVILTNIMSLREMQHVTKEWGNIRHNFSSHLNPDYVDDWEIKQQEVSRFLHSIHEILTLLNSIPQTPLRDKNTKFISYTISGVPHNFESSSYIDFGKFLKNETFT